jgi:FMN-dependent NADH-azoreductase
MKLLHIDSSALGGDSVSRQLSKKTVAQWRAAHPGTVVEYLDVAANAPTHLSSDSLGFRLGYEDKSLTEVQRRENEISERLVSQFLAADVIVIGAPMYNFGITVQLKSWFDAIARAGVSFKYGPTGPVGLLTGKKVYVAVTRGGLHKDAPSDTQLPHLKTFLNFVGLNDVQFVFSEGHGMGPEAVAKARIEAEEQINAVLV